MNLAAMNVQRLGRAARAANISIQEVVQNLYDALRDAVRSEDGLANLDHLK
jgi:hypothetical protein